MSESVNKRKKRDRFLRVAEKRTREIIRLMRKLGNCANPNSYEYTQEEVQKIMGEISSEFLILKLRFKQESKVEFNFVKAEKKALSEEGEE